MEHHTDNGMYGRIWCKQATTGILHERNVWNCHFIQHYWWRSTIIWHHPLLIDLSILTINIYIKTNADMSIMTNKKSITRLNIISQIYRNFVHMLLIFICFYALLSRKKYTSKLLWTTRTVQSCLSNSQHFYA